MVAAARLPFVPGWRIAQGVILCVGLACAVLVVLGAGVAHFRRSASAVRRLWIACGVLVAVIAIGGAALLLAWDSLGASGLAGEDLVRAVEDPRGTILVYECSTVPDGVVASRVAVRRGWLPFERTLLQARGTLSDVRTAAGEVLFTFGSGVRARYRPADGHLEFSPDPELAASLPHACTK